MSEASPDRTPQPPQPRHGHAPRSRRPRRRAFYAIGEVCEMFDLRPHVLRYWETQFDQLKPSKNRAGARVYQESEVETIALIRRLVHEERYTIEGARRRMEEMREQGSLPEQSSRSLERAFLRSLEAELTSLLDLLDPSR
jgi:DNA-binding transcriptional MerR regulator